jgi:putative ABC transport system permease protein
MAVTPATNVVFCVVVGTVVIGFCTSLVVDSRRGSLARLALTGATPSQVVSTIMSQLAVVSLACSLVGDLLAFVALRPTLRLLAYERGEGTPAPEPVYAVWPVLLASLLAVGLALAGGYKQARRASRISPVEALRQSGVATGQRMTVLRWVGVVVCMLLVVAAFLAIPQLTADPTGDTLSALVQAGMTPLVGTAVLLALLAPAVVGPLTRAWTSLVPSFDPSWDLSRSTTVVKAARLTKSVVPVMMTVGLLFGMLAVGQVFQSSLYANGYDVRLTGAGFASTLVFLGSPLAIALAGGVGSLVMMSKQRDAELALSGIVGTTPGQRFAMPVMEGVVVTVTGALLALVMVAVPIAFLAVGLPAAGFEFAFSPSSWAFALAFAVALAVTVAATLLPTLASLRRPEPRVIARLVAE